MNYRGLGLFGVFILIVGCGADPDTTAAGNPGACRLICTGSKLASNDMRVRFLMSEENQWSCSPGLANFPYTVPLRFVIEKSRGVSPAEVMAKNPGMPADGDAHLWVPVAGISFHPLAFGGGVRYFAEDTAAERGRFVGVATPKNQWCTDTCGVGSLEVRPSCAGPYTIGIYSASLFNTYTYDIEPPEDAAALRSAKKPLEKLGGGAGISPAPPQLIKPVDLEAEKVRP